MHGGKKMLMGQYSRLLLMAALSFISMYVLMYSMVDTISNVYPNFNQFYMAALMTAPMVLIEIFVMRGMYGNWRLNALVIALSSIALIGSFTLIRQQTEISDSQFLKSMIPHHGAAILMCKQAPIEDEEIKKLCQNIISSQQSEIDQMKKKLQILNK